LFRAAGFSTSSFGCAVLSAKIRSAPSSLLDLVFPGCDFHFMLLFPVARTVSRSSGLRRRLDFFFAAGAASPFGLVRLSFFTDRPCCLVFRPAREFVGRWISRSSG
jgi:hypothetical protein